MSEEEDLDPTNEVEPTKRTGSSRWSYENRVKDSEPDKSEMIRELFPTFQTPSVFDFQHAMRKCEEAYQMGYRDGMDFMFKAMDGKEEKELELERCPACGSIARLHDDINDNYYVQCSNYAECSMQTASYVFQNVAVEKWNTRYSPEQKLSRFAEAIIDCEKTMERYHEDERAAEQCLEHVMSIIGEVIDEALEQEKVEIMERSDKERSELSEGEERVKEVSEELYKKMLEYRAPVISEAMKLIAMGEDVDMQKLIDEADAKAEQDYENINSRNLNKGE